MASKYMYLLYLLILSLTCSESYEKSIIIKTNSYGDLKFGGVIGLFYPQYLQIEQNQQNIRIMVYNMTQNGKNITKMNTIPKRKIFDCQFALQTVDYGYYTKFPHYQIIADCFNQTHQQVDSIILYRSGDYKLISGDIVSRAPEENNCQLGPLRVQYLYSSIGQPSTFIYRFCLKKLSQYQSLYKRFRFQQKNPQIITQTQIQSITGLKNLSIVDMQHNLGINGAYTAFLSQKYGLIINGGSPSKQKTWSIPGGQKPYKVKKLCWSNKLAILTEGFIYFLSVSFDLNNITINFTTKTERILVRTTSQCNFYTIGSFAICSIYNRKDTTMYIYSQNRNKIPTNITETFPNEQFIPYISQDLCSTNSFYYKNSKYQFYFEQSRLDQNNYCLKRTQLLSKSGDFLNYVDEGTVFAISSQALNESHMNLIYQGFQKSSKDFTVIKNMTVSNNISRVQLFYQNSTSNLPIISSLFTDHTIKKTLIQLYLSNSRTSPNYTSHKNLVLDISTSNIGYLKSLGNISQSFYALQTPIQRDAYARLTVTTGVQLRYPYQFETIGFRPCSISTADNQLLLYRQDSDGLTVMRIGFRNKNFLALDDVLTLHQYKEYDAQCTYDGLILTHRQKNQIRILNSNLLQIAKHPLQFSSLKHTKSLLLVQIKDKRKVQVMHLISGKLIKQFIQWKIEDIVTNIYSSGFINNLQRAYYQFTNQNSQCSVNEKASLNDN